MTREFAKRKLPASMFIIDDDPAFSPHLGDWTLNSKDWCVRCHPGVYVVWCSRELTEPKCGNMAPKCVNIAPKRGDMVPKRGNMVPQCVNKAPKCWDLAPTCWDVVPKYEDIVTECGYMVPKCGKIVPKCASVSTSVHGVQPVPSLIAIQRTACGVLQCGTSIADAFELFRQYCLVRCQ